MRNLLPFWSGGAVKPEEEEDDLFNQLMNGNSVCVEQPLQPGKMAVSLKNLFYLNILNIKLVLQLTIVLVDSFT